MSDETRWDACYYGPRCNIAGDDGPSTNNRAVADRHARQYNCMRAEPYVVTDADSAAFTSLVSDQHSGLMSVVVIGDKASWRNENVMPYVKLESNVNLGAETDKRFGTERQGRVLLD